MVKKKIIFLVVLLADVLLIGRFLLYSYYNGKGSFSVKTVLLKLNIPIGGESVYKVKITNNANTERVFNLNLENLEGIASLTDKEFTLAPWEEREVSVYFKDDIREVGVYPGELVISNSLLTKRIPIVIVLEDNKYVFSIIISEMPKYSNVYPGGKLGVEIKVYNQDEVVAPTVRAKYYIKNIKGEILWTNEGDLVVDGAKTEIVTIPENWNKENYVFVVLIDYKETKTIASYFFSVSSKDTTLFQDNILLPIVISMIFVFGIFILFFYFIKSRDDFLLQLKRQQNEELSRNLQLIECSKKKIETTVKAPVEKKTKIRELEKIKKKVIKTIKKKHLLQGKELKKLKRTISRKTLKKEIKKKHKPIRLKEKRKPKVIRVLKKKSKRDIEEDIRKKRVNEIKGRLSSWKEEGYKLSDTEEEIKRITNPKKQTENWKKQGYKI